MLKRILALSLALALAICVLTSCDLLAPKDASAIVDEAEKQLALTDHTVNISITFTSSDPDMNEALSALDNSKVTLMRNGDYAKIDLLVSFGEEFVKDSYTIADGVIYHSLDSGVDGVKSIKEKAALTEADKQNAIKDAGAAAIISYDDFDNVTIESSSDVQLITCKDIKAESLSGLTDIFKSNFDGLVDSVSVSGAELVIRILDGKYNGTYLSCEYSVVVDGVTYDVRMQAVREYDVTTPVFIGTPADADDYIDTTYSEMMK